MHSPRPSFIVLGTGMLAFVACAAAIAHQSARHPRGEGEAGLAHEVDALGERVTEARRSIAEVRELELESRQAAKKLAALHQGSPAGPALVWFPQRVKEHFRGFKIPNATLRMTITRNAPELPGYEQVLWTVEFPVENATRDMRNALFAILELDAGDPFVRVTDIAIGPDPADSSRHVAMAEVTLLAPNSQTISTVRLHERLGRPTAFRSASPGLREAGYPGSADLPSKKP